MSSPTSRSSLSSSFTRRLLLMLILVLFCTPLLTVATSPFSSFGLSRRQTPSSPTAPSAALEGGHGGRRSTPTLPGLRRAMRIAHGTLMASAFALVFPLGAILLRMLPVSRRPVRAHYALQMLGYAMVLGGMGLGLWLGLEVRYLDYAHTVVGFVVVSLVGVQALLGALGHRRVLGREKEGLGSGIWQTGVHRWLGRVVLVAGVVNGGLGLALADNTTGGRVAYGVVAGVMGVLCLSLTGWKVHLRHRAANRRRLTIF